MRQLAFIAEKFDKGYGHFTTRQNIQYNWPKLTELSEDEFKPLRLMNGLYLQLHAYMLRVAIPYGTLNSAKMRQLAFIAEKFDKGYGHFTTRQNIQYNWPKLTELSEDEFKPLRLMNGLYLQLHAYMLRVAIPYGTLNSAKMRQLAFIAEKFDKGYGHFTTRQNIQYNWPKLTELSEDEFKPLRLMNGLYLQLHAYMLRVAIPYGTLNSAKMRQLAFIAEKFDKGYGHFTTRQNIQYNWPKLTELSEDEFKPLRLMNGLYLQLHAYMLRVAIPYGTLNSAKMRQLAFIAEKFDKGYGHFTTRQNIQYNWPKLTELSEDEFKPLRLMNGLYLQLHAYMLRVAIPYGTLNSAKMRQLAFIAEKFDKGYGHFTTRQNIQYNWPKLTELSEDEFKPLRLMNGLYLQLHAYMLRVAIPYGTLNSAKMRQLAFIAEKFDKGYGHFTTRQNIQYNWPKLTELSEDEFKPLRLMNGLYLQLHAYMLRVAIPYGTLNSAKMRQLAFIAEKFDKGYGHFTTRQNIQYNWPKLTELSEDEFKPLRLMNGLYLQLHAYMLRVAIPYGTLNSAKMRQLAFIAEKFDKGYGHFTTRQNIQYNWPKLTELSEDEFKPLRLMNGLYLQLHAYMLRVAIPYGTLNSAKMRQLAFIAEKFDKGYGHFTTRQNIQYNWPKLTELSEDEFKPLRLMNGLYLQLHAYMLRVAIPYGTLNSAKMRQLAFIAEKFDKGYGHFTTRQNIQYNWPKLTELSEDEFKPLRLMNGLYLQLHAYMLRVAIPYGTLNSAKMRQLAFIAEKFDKGYGHFTTRQNIQYNWPKLTELSEDEFKPLRLMNGLYLQLHAYMLRVAIPYGTLNSAKMRQLAFIAEKFDKGYGHFTTRQNIQYNWPKLTELSEDEFKPLRLMNGLYLQLHAYMLRVAIPYGTLNSAKMRQLAFIAEKFDKGYGHFTTRQNIQYNWPKLTELSEDEFKPLRLMNGLYLQLHAYMLRVAIPYGTLNSAKMRQLAFIAEKFDKGYGHFTTRQNIQYNWPKLTELSEDEFKPLRLMNGLYLQLHAYMLRVAIPYGTLNSAKMRQLAFIAEKFDKGYGHFTTRQNIQYNWPKLTELSEDEFKPLRLMNGLYLQLHAYMLRVAIPYGTLNSAKMRQLAFIAEKFDKGYGHFTTRQNIQYNWPKLTELSEDEFKPLRLMNGLYLQLHAYMLRVAIPYGTLNSAKMRQLAFIAEKFDKGYGHFTTRQNIQYNWPKLTELSEDEFKPLRLMNGLYLQLHAYMLRVAIPYGTLNSAKMRQLAFIAEKFDKGYGHFTTRQNIQYNWPKLTELSEDEFKPLRLMNGLYLQLHAYMLRVAIPYGTLNSAKMRQLAFIAEKFDKGYGHFTTRQNIQYNWPKLTDRQLAFIAEKFDKGYGHFTTRQNIQYNWPKLTELSEDEFKPLRLMNGLYLQLHAYMLRVAIPYGTLNSAKMRQLAFIAEKFDKGYGHFTTRQNIQYNWPKLTELSEDEFKPLRLMNGLYLQLHAYMLRVAIPYGTLNSAKMRQLAFIAEKFDKGYGHFTTRQNIQYNWPKLTELSEDEFKPLRLMNGLYLQLHAYMLRVAIPYGTLNSAKMRQLAFIAEKFDKGYGHFTTRQNIQYNWPKLTELSEDEFKPLRLMNGLYLQLHAYMLRVAIPYGTLNSAKMRQLAFIAEKFDKGYGHFTTRQNIQYNWPKLTELSEDEFKPLRLMNGLYLQLHAYMLRVAIPYGTLNSAKMRQLAFIAEKFDKGYGHFTTRQNIQYNWPKLTELSEDEFKPLRLMNGLYLQLHAYMLRVAIPYGTLNSAKMRQLAFIAEKFDKGYGHFTTRQNIQYNWPKLTELCEDEFKPLRLMNGLYLQLHAYMLRVAIPYGTLNSAKMRQLAFIAEKFDKGYGHFTTRQNIQYNWPKLTELSEDEFKPLRLMNGLYLQLHAYMLRVAIPYGTLNSAKMRQLAFIAEKFDKGYGHFTTRQNIQYNWPKLTELSEDEFKPLRLMNGLYLQLHAYMLRVAIPYGTLNSAKCANWRLLPRNLTRAMVISPPAKISSITGRNSPSSAKTNSNPCV